MAISLAYSDLLSDVGVIIVMIGIIVSSLFAVKTLVYTLLYLFFYNPDNENKDKKPFKGIFKAFMDRMHSHSDNLPPPPGTSE